MFNETLKTFLEGYLQDRDCKFIDSLASDSEAPLTGEALEAVRLQFDASRRDRAMALVYLYITSPSWKNKFDDIVINFSAIDRSYTLLDRRGKLVAAGQFFD